MSALNDESPEESALDEKDLKALRSRLAAYLDDLSSHSNEEIAAAVANEKRSVLLPRIGGQKRSLFMPRIGQTKKGFHMPRVGRRSYSGDLSEYFTADMVVPEELYEKKAYHMPRIGK